MPKAAMQALQKAAMKAAIKSTRLPPSVAEPYRTVLVRILLAVCGSYKHSLSILFLLVLKITRQELLDRIQRRRLRLQYNEGIPHYKFMGLLLIYRWKSQEVVSLPS